MKNVIIIVFFLLSHSGFAQDDSGALASISQPKASKVYTENGRMGLLKNTHKLITPAVYDTLYMVNSDRYVGKRFSSTIQQPLWGIINESGDQIIPFKYRVLQIEHTLVVVGLSSTNLMTFGVYTIDGEEVLAPNYHSVKILSSQLISTSSGSKTHLFDNLGNKIIQLDADSVSLLDPNLLKFYHNGKAGVTRLNNQLVLPPEYADIKVLDDDILVKGLPEWHIIQSYDTLRLHYEKVIDWQENYIVSIGNKSYLINSTNSLLSKPYDKITKVNSDFSRVLEGNNWGIINSFGKEIIPTKYAAILNDQEVIYCRAEGEKGKWILFDYYGFKRTKLKYDSIKLISEGRIAIQRNDKWGFLDRYGVEVISPIFDDVQRFRDGLAIVKFYGEEGIIDRSGKWVAIPYPIDIIDYTQSSLLGIVEGQYQIKSFDGELIYFTKNQLKMTDAGFVEIDSSRIEVRNISLEGTFKYGSSVDNSSIAGGAGLVIFKKNGKYGFRDQQKRIVIANRYDAVKPFHQRVAAININGKWGFINLEEELIIQPRYDSVGHFINGICLTKRDGLFGALSSTGKVLVKSDYKKLLPMVNGQFKVQKNSLWGVLDENGAVVIHPKYNQLILVNQRFYIVERRGKYGTIASNGVNNIPIIYDFIDYNIKTKTLVTKLSQKNEWAFSMKAHSVNN